MDPFQNTARKKMILTVFIIIISQLCVSTYFMATHKNGYYADDMYSYGFANSAGQFSPLVTKGEETIRYNEWKDGRDLLAYLTVSEDEIFSYGQILRNIEHDAHPPLFYFLLHFMCSLTPNVFSKWSGYIINAAAFILLQVFLYRLTLFISKSRSIGLLTMTMFGFTSAAINVMSLLRMYMLGAALAVTFTFYAFRYLQNTGNKKPLDKNLFLCLVSLYFASLTAYIDIILAFFLTFCACVMMLAKRQVRKTLCFGSFMLLAVGLMVVSFQTFFIQMGLDQSALVGESGYPFMLQMRMGIHVMTNGLFGIGTPIFPSMIPLYILWSIMLLAVLYLIASFLFRKDAWFLSFRKNAWKNIKTTFKKSLPYLYYIIPVFLSCTLMLIYFAKELKLYFYRYDSMRYLFLLTPFYLMCILIVLFKFLKPNALRIPIVILVIISSVSLGNKNFLEEVFETKKLAEITAGSDVVLCEEQTNVFMFHIADILNCHEFYYTNPKSIHDDVPRERIGKKDSERNMYLMVDVGAESADPVKSFSLGSDGRPSVEVIPYNDIYYYFKSIPEYSGIEYIGEYSTCYLYKLK